MRYFLISCLLLVITSSVSAQPDDFIDIRELISDIELDIRYFSADNFVGQAIEGYEKPACILSKKAARALKDVQLELNKDGLGLKIFDCYRPQRAVEYFVSWAKDLDDIKMKSRFYPNVEKKNLFKQRYIAEKSGHSRGSTVDLTIVKLDHEPGQEMDMGTAWDFFDLRSWPESQHVTKEQQANRLYLKNIMSRFGFSGIREEWWHFTVEDEPFPDQYFDFVIR